jgi:AhpD family alkylhydroperoxidase
VAIWFGHRLDPAFREEIMVAVAAADNCRQCSYAHREWALAEGLPEAELAALEGLQVEFFDKRKWTAIVWAQAFASSDFTDVPDAIETSFRREFGSQEQADIELVARTMYWMNEASNGVDAALLRLKGKPVPGGRPLKELEALLLYVIIVPFLFVMLAIKRRRSLISLIRGIGPFFREFEARRVHTAMEIMSDSNESGSSVDSVPEAK